MCCLKQWRSWKFCIRRRMRWPDGSTIHRPTEDRNSNPVWDVIPHKLHIYCIGLYCKKVLILRFYCTYFIFSLNITLSFLWVMLTQLYLCLKSTKRWCVHNCNQMIMITTAQTRQPPLSFPLRQILLLFRHQIRCKIRFIKCHYFLSVGKWGQVGKFEVQVGSFFFWELFSNYSFNRVICRKRMDTDLSMWNPLAWSDTGTPWFTEAQVNGLGTTRQVCSTGPPQPMTGSKPGWMSGDQGRMMLSSTPNHTITMLTHIMAFPADRFGMPLFVLVLYSWALWNVRLHDMQRKHWISPSLTSNYLFVSLTQCRPENWQTNALRLKWSGMCWIISCYIQWGFVSYLLCI